MITRVLPVPAPGQDAQRPTDRGHRLALGRLQVGEERVRVEGGHRTDRSAAACTRPAPRLSASGATFGACVRSRRLQNRPLRPRAEGLRCPHSPPAIASGWERRGRHQPMSGPVTAPPHPAPAPTRHAPTGITILAVLSAIGGVLSILGGHRPGRPRRLRRRVNGSGGPVRHGAIFGSSLLALRDREPGLRLRRVDAPALGLDPRRRHSRASASSSRSWRSSAAATSRARSSASPSPGSSCTT